jgi:hypothetical protein
MVAYGRIWSDGRTPGRLNKLNGLNELRGSRVDGDSGEVKAGQRQSGASASVRCGGDWDLNCRGRKWGPKPCDALDWCACIALLFYSPACGRLLTKERAGSAEFLSDRIQPATLVHRTIFLVASTVPIETCCVILRRQKHFLLWQQHFGGQDGGQVRET